MAAVMAEMEVPAEFSFPVGALVDVHGKRGRSCSSLGLRSPKHLFCSVDFDSHTLPQRICSSFLTTK